MTMCMDPEKHQEQIKAVSETNFGQYLDKLQLPNILRKSLVNVIAFSTEQTSVTEVRIIIFQYFIDQFFRKTLLKFIYVSSIFAMDRIRLIFLCCFCRR